MPVLTQLNLNIGTEQNPNMVLHDLHDIRISSTDVNTVTRLLGCDAGVNSIAPLTLANAASLLGESGYLKHIKNIIKSAKITIPAGEAVKIDNTKSGIIIISNEGTLTGTIIAGTIYGNQTISNITGGTSISGLSVLKNSGMDDISLSNSGNSDITVSYTFYSSGSQYNIP